MRKVLPLAAIAVALAVWLILSSRGEKHAVSLATVERMNISTLIATNGKVEPIESAIVRSPIAAQVRRVPPSVGDEIKSGAVVAELDLRNLGADLQAAQARVSAAMADLNAARAGGNPRPRVEIEEQIGQLKLRLAAARTELQTLERLAARNAATQEEVRLARAEVSRLETELTGLHRQLGSLTSPTDTQAAQARLEEAGAAVAGISARLGQALLRSPISGVLYDLAIRPGAFVEAGGEVARVGNLSRVRVRLYVDEPELGRVQEGQPVTITWDAMPGRTWEGTIERGATQIIELGSRQVGEVLSTVDNTSRDLIPGTNVNAAIQAAEASGVLAIPKEALRTRDNRTGVFRLEDAKVRWQPVQIGLSNITHVEVTQGLSQGDKVALAANPELEDGDTVQAPEKP